MNEMRMNHCRGVVTNLVVAQNRKDQRPEGISHRWFLYCNLWWATGTKMAWP